MTELERALVALGHELEYPPQPELASAVRKRLERRWERPLAVGLGPPLSRDVAELRAHLAVKLPEGQTPTQYYAQPGLIATLLSFHGKPILLAELRNDQMGFFKKYVGPGTKVDPVDLGSFGLWIR